MLCQEKITPLTLFLFKQLDVDKFLLLPWTRTNLGPAVHVSQTSTPTTATVDDQLLRKESIPKIARPSTTAQTKYIRKRLRGGNHISYNVIRASHAISNNKLMTRNKPILQKKDDNAFNPNSWIPAWRQKTRQRQAKQSTGWSTTTSERRVRVQTIAHQTEVFHH